MGEITRIDPLPPIISSCPTIVIWWAGRPSWRSSAQMLTEDTERAVVVSGEPGVGKTALIEQLCVARGGRGLAGGADPGGGGRATLRVGRAESTGVRAEENQAELDEADRAVLAPVFGGDPDSVVAVLPLASGLLNLLAVAGQNQPVLLVVDDVHWLDKVSAEVLGAVGRRLSHPGVRIVAGQRTPHESAFSSAGWGEVPLAPLDRRGFGAAAGSAGVPMTAATRTAILAAARRQSAGAGRTSAIRRSDRGRACGALPLTERLVAVFGGRLENLDAGVRAELLRAALDGIAGSVRVLDAGPVRDARRPARSHGGAAGGGSAGGHRLSPSAGSRRGHPSGRSRRNAATPTATSPHSTTMCWCAAPRTWPRRPLEPDQDVADLLARAAKLSIRRGGLSVAVEWLRRAAELSTDPDRRTELFADAVFVAARAGQPGEAEELLEEHRDRRGDSALAVLADCYRAFHADGEVISTHRRVLDALAKADDTRRQNAEPACLPAGVDHQLLRQRPAPGADQRRPAAPCRRGWTRRS